MKKIAGILLIASLVFACTKVAVLRNEPASKKFDMKAAKEWYYGTFKKQRSFSASNAASMYYHSGNQNKYPAWQYAQSYNMGSWSVVEMPLYLDNKVVLIPGASALSQEDKQRVRKSVIEKVAFFKANADNRVVTRIIQLVPDIDYLKAHNYDISANRLNAFQSDFTGWVITREWTGKTLKFWRFVNGKRTQQLKLIPRMKKASNAALREECGWVEVEKVHHTCLIIPPAGDIPDDPGECEDYDTTYTYETEWVCTEVPDEEDECAGYINSDDCVCAIYGLCGGDDGGGDGGGTNPEPPADEDDLKDELVDTCLQNAYNKLTQANIKNKITNLMYSTFAESELFNLTVIESDTLPSNIDGRTSYSYSGDTLNIVIRLNVNELPYSSQEYTAATIFHEAVHAYLLTVGKLGMLNQHNNMANDYLNELKNALDEIYPNLSDDEVAALAWGGLEGTTAYGDLTDTQKDLLRDLNNYHRAGSPAFGTKCKERPND